ncbi:MAG TPA: hypothetical protein PKC39_11225 [Ferruginibacter sp.]|nr:hypothetical protein [Ferruginibacter sp.]HMP21520.1 hypothetical protein [Ferruginibacter sp.]
METIIIKPRSLEKTRRVLDFLKKERIKAEVYKEPAKKDILNGIEAGAKQAGLYLSGKLTLKDAKQLLNEL